MKTEEIHDMTSAEIGRLNTELQRERREVIAELAALFAATEAGDRVEPPLSDRHERVRTTALSMLNGYSPQSLRVKPSGETRQSELEVRRDAIDLVLETLSTKDLFARANEAAEFFIENGDEWTELCRATLLTAVRLQALEAKAQEWRKKLRGQVPKSMPLAGWIGLPRSILNIPWAQDPLSRPREAAIEAKLVSPKDLREAGNV